MKKRQNFKKMLAVTGLLTIAVPASLAVVACKEKQTEQEPKLASEDYSVLVAHFISKTNYSQQIVRNANIEHLKKTITASFIKNKLSPEISKHFRNDLFTLIKITNENGGEILDSDFQLPKTINAKIIFDYANFKTQTTNLKIEVEEDRISLEEFVKDFKFSDNKNVEGFLDANNLDLITKQIEEYFGESLSSANLSLENRTSNSIQLLAAADSTNYKGKATLTWDLKLIEIWTSITTAEVDDAFLRAGLLGYFYLEKETNFIKYIDIYGLKSEKNRVIHKWISDYHWIRFSQQKQLKAFNFKGNSSTDEVEAKFGSFDFRARVSVDIWGPETENIKFFVNNKWDTLSSDSITFDSLGELSWRD